MSKRRSVGRPGRLAPDACDNPAALLVARRFLISGRVQGVGFRYFTYEHARREGVSGTVRNLPDGRVEVEVEGDSESVERVERAVRRGPPGARVQDVVTHVLEPSGRPREFTID
jgi:acylphosphatase